MRSCLSLFALSLIGFSYFLLCQSQAQTRVQVRIYKNAEVFENEWQSWPSYSSEGQLWLEHELGWLYSNGTYEVIDEATNGDWIFWGPSAAYASKAEAYSEISAFRDWAMASTYVFAGDSYVGGWPKFLASSSTYTHNDRQHFRVLPKGTSAPAVPKPVISSPDTETLTVGVSREIWINASNDPTSYGASGLPPGMSCDSNSGKISGAPTKVGTFKVTYSATNAGGTGKKLVIYNVLMAEPQFIEHPQNQEVRRGDWIELSALATPHAFNKYQWWSYAERFSSDSYANPILKATLRNWRLVADWDLVGKYYCEATNAAGFDRSNQAEVGVFEVTDRHLTAVLQEPGIVDTDDYLFLEDGIAASVPLKALDFFFVAHDRFADTFQVQPDYLYAIPGRLVPASTDKVVNQFGTTYYRAHTTKTNEIWLPAGFVRVGALWMSELTFGGFWRNSSTNEIIGLIYEFDYTFAAERADELELTFGMSDVQSGKIVLQIQDAPSAWTVDWVTGGESLRWPTAALLHGGEETLTGRLVHDGVGGLVNPGGRSWSSTDLEVEQSQLDAASLPFSFIENEHFHDDHPWVGAADSPLFFLNQIGSASMQLPVQTVKRAGWPHFQTPLFSRPEERYLPELKPEMSASLWLRWYAVVEDPQVAEWRSEAPVLDGVALRMGLLRTPLRYVGLSTSWSGGIPEEYRASERADFSGASWQPYQHDTAILLSAGAGTKTVYVQLRNAAGESAVRAASIKLSAPGTDVGGAFAEITVAPGGVARGFEQSLGEVLPGEEYKIKGLPAGMRMDRWTGELTGAPLKAGDYRVSVQVRNGKTWSTPISAVLQIEPLPPHLVGSFWGLVQADETANEGLGGQVRVTVADTGLFTAEVFSGKLRKNYRGRLEWNAYDEPTARFYAVYGAYAHQQGYILPTEDGSFTGAVGEWFAEAPVSGWRSGWRAKGNPAPSFATGSFNSLLVPEVEVLANEAEPQGIGFAQIGISNGGVVKWVLSAPDGRKFTASTPMSEIGEIGVWGLLDKGVGYLAAAGAISTEGNLAGYGEWYLSASGKGPYPDGVGLPGSPRELKLLGARYSPPGELLFGLSDALDNAELAFLGGGVDEIITVTLGTDNQVRLAKAGTAGNPFALKLKLDLKKGLISGGRTFADLPDGRSGVKSSFRGLLVPKANLGAGHFLLPSSGGGMTSGALIFGPPGKADEVFSED